MFLFIYLSAYQFFVYLSIRLSICLSVYLPLGLSVYLCVCLSVYLLVCLTFCLSVYLSVFLSVFLSIFLSIYLPIYLSICLSVCLSVCLCIYVFVYLSCPSAYLFFCLCLSICLSVCLSVYLSRCLSVCLSVCLFIYLFVYVSFCLSVYLLIYLSVYLSLFLFVCLSVSVFFCLSVCLSVSLSLCLFVCLSVCLSTRVPEAGVRLPRKLLRKAAGLPGTVAVLLSTGVVHSLPTCRREEELWGIADIAHKEGAFHALRSLVSLEGLVSSLFCVLAFETVILGFLPLCWSWLGLWFLGSAAFAFCFILFFFFFFFFFCELCLKSLVWRTPCFGWPAQAHAHFLMGCELRSRRAGDHMASRGRGILAAAIPFHPNAPWNSCSRVWSNLERVTLFWVWIRSV